LSAPQLVQITRRGYYARNLTRTPLETLALALVDGAIGALVLVLALSHAPNRMVWAQFAVCAAIILFFKGRDAVRRIPALVSQARASANLAQDLGPWWLRVTRLVVGYDTWSRTERLGIIVLSVLICVLFGWDNGGPFAAALFLAIGTVNGVLACIALVARRVPG
jgi:peptidoglycan biosynthesis protein MviN/MurJ (putative lipid II flippase)